MKNRALIPAANEATQAIGAANALAAVAPESTSVGHADNWFQVAPFGSHPHARGVQVFDQQAANSIVSMFRSAKDKFARAWRGLPIFIGHPDLDPKAYPDKRKYGSIQALETREDGLYAQPKWSNAGKELVNDEHYDFQSPFWLMQPIPGQPGAFRPVELISVGLTNNPNIPGKPVGANTADNDDLDPMKREDLIKKLNLKPVTGAAEVTDDQIDSAVSALLSAGNEKTTLAEQLRVANEAKTTAERVKTEQETLAANERKARIGDKLSAAVVAGKITEAEKPAWQARFETDFAAADTAFGALVPAVNVRAGNAAHTANLGQRNGGAVALDRDSRIRAANVAVDKYMKDNGCEDYATAFAEVQRTQPALFKDMHQPETEAAKKAA